MFVDLPDGAVTDNAGDHVQCEVRLIGPLLDKGNDKHHNKDREQGKRNQSVVHEVESVSYRINGDFSLGNLVVAEVEAVNPAKHYNGGYGGNEHCHGNHSAFTEIGDRTHHCGVELSSDHFIFTGNGNRNTEVGK